MWKCSPRMTCPGKITISSLNKKLIIVAGIVCGAVFAVHAVERFSCDAGYGKLLGDITYQIGGTIIETGAAYSAPFPISELVFPLNADVARGAAELRAGSWLFSGSLEKSISGGAAKMYDSDWDDPYDPGLKTVYSESDAQLDAVSGDCSVIFFPFSALEEYIEPGLSEAGIGCGWAWQEFNWKMSNVDQSYPSTPLRPHDMIAGATLTYQARIVMPYLALLNHWKSEKTAVTIRLDIVPAATIADEDDHLLRTKKQRSTCAGNGFKVSLAVRRFLGERWFATINAEYRYLDCKGRAESWFYGGPYNGAFWTIDEKIVSRQLAVSAGAGFRF